jgi:putative ABC transport system ATP-binding protein
MATIVSIHDATKEYHLGNVSVPALRGVSLDVTSGDFLSIAGPSGSGKTTLLNLIGCVDTPTSGYVEVAGKNTSQLSERALTRLRLYTIGFIFQSFNLVSVLDVFRNVELPLLLQHNSTARERSTRVHELLERVGLKDYLKHRPSELSGGQRQRVAIARALVTRPQLVLADEPTANLDSATGQNILDLMRELNHADGTTFIFSTHDARVMKYASAVVRLADGKLADTTAAASATDPVSMSHSFPSGATEAERAELEAPAAGPLATDSPSRSRTSSGNTKEVGSS